MAVLDSIRGLRFDRDLGFDSITLLKTASVIVFDYPEGFG